MIDATTKSLSFNTSFFSPRSHTLCSTIIGKKLCVSAVSTLLRLRGPSTVLRGVSSIVINPFKRVFWGRFPHIFSKFNEVMPSLTNGYTTSLIMLLMVLCGFITASHHVYPRPIAPSIITAVYKQLLPPTLTSKAPTASSPTTSQVSSPCDVSISTVTLTKPLDFVILNTVKTFNYQTPESLPNSVNKHSCISCFHYTTAYDGCQGVYNVRYT